MPLAPPAAVGLVVQTDGARAARQSRGVAALAWAGQRFSALSSCHRPRRGPAAALLCCGAACLGGLPCKKNGGQCNHSGELLHRSGLACPHCLQPSGTPRACLCTVSTSGSHKWPPIATGSFFAQVAVAVAPDDPHHVCSLARPPPSPCPIAFTDFIFPCRAPCAELRGGGGLRVFDVLDPNGRCSIPQLQLLVPCKRKTTPSHPPTPRISNQTPVPLTPTLPRLAGLAVDAFSTRWRRRRRWGPSPSLGEAGAARRAAVGRVGASAVVWPGGHVRKKMAAVWPPCIRRARVLCIQVCVIVIY